MPQLITPGQVVVMTKEGEVSVAITLELNINLNTSGEITATVKAKETEGELQKLDKPKSKYEDVEWEIPEFTSGVKVDFGKNKE